MMYIGLKCLLGHTVHIDTYVDRTQGGSVILEWLKRDNNSQDIFGSKMALPRCN